WPAFMALFLMLFGMVAFSKVIFSGGLRTIRRYLRRRRAELLEPAIAAEIDLLLGWSAVAGGCLWLFFSAVADLFVVVLLVSYLEVWSRLARATPCSMNAGRTSTWLRGLSRH